MRWIRQTLRTPRLTPRTIDAAGKYVLPGIIKGSLTVGADADLVIFDPTKTQTISAATQHSKACYTLHEGRTVMDALLLTMQRGQTIVANGQLLVQPGHARFLKTNTSAESDPGAALDCASAVGFVLFATAARR